MTISRGQMPRQMYGLGSFVKSIGKGVKSAVSGVKDFVKSDAGKALGIAALTFGIPGTSFGGLLGRSSFMVPGGKAVPGLLGFEGIGPAFSAAKTKLGLDVATGDKPTFGQFAKVFGLGSLGGMALQALEASGATEEDITDIDALRSYMRQGYKQLNPNARPEDVDAFVEQNTVEYRANGGRIGYADAGSVRKDPDEVIAGMSNELNPGFFDQLPLIGGYKGKYPVDADQGASLIEEIQKYKYGQPSGEFTSQGEIPKRPPMSMEQTIKALEDRWDMAIEEGYEPGKGGEFDDLGIYSKEDIRRRVELGYDQAKSPKTQTGIMKAANGGRIGFNDGSYNPGARYRFLIDKFNKGETLTDDEVRELEALEMSYADRTKEAYGGRIGYNQGTGDPTYTGNNLEDLPRGLQIDTTTRNPIPEDALPKEIEMISKIMMGPGIAGMGEPEDGTMKGYQFFRYQYLPKKVKELSENFGYSEDEIYKMINTRVREYIGNPGKPLMAMGGRIKYANGSEDYEDRFMKLVAELREAGFSQQEAIEEAREKLSKDMAEGGRIGFDQGTPEDFRRYLEEREMIEKMMKQNQLMKEYEEDMRRKKVMEQKQMVADGGRIGYAFGDSAEDNAIQASGVMGLPLNRNPAGITELDLRETGGFIPPVGVKEKADDIPAMLSNNEFVFTADAVRGMGDGDVNKGAQRMYDMMKKLENGGRV